MAGGWTVGDVQILAIAAFHASFLGVVISAASCHECNAQLRRDRCGGQANSGGGSESVRSVAGIAISALGITNGYDG